MRRDQIIDSIKSVAEDFDTIARHTILNKNLNKHVHEVNSIINLSPNTTDIKILDVGGGMGVNLLTLAKLNYGKEYSLVDRFDEYLSGTSMGTYDEAAIERFSKYNISFYNQDVVSKPVLNFESDYFDIVTIIDVIEHLPANPIQLLTEINRVLKSGGTIYMASPNLFGLNEIVNFLSGKHAYIKFNEWIKPRYYSHFREYTYAEHKKLLELAGFHNIHTTFNQHSFWLRFKREHGLNALKYLAGFFVTSILPFTKSSITVTGNK